MNTDLTTAAVQRLTAQLGEALFNQPGLDLIEIANRCNAESALAGGALLGSTAYPVAWSWVGRDHSTHFTEEADTAAEAQRLGKAVRPLYSHASALPKPAKPEAVRLRDELREQLQVQLAGCGVVAISNTREALKQQMPEKGAYGWSKSLLEVHSAILREINQRERADAAEKAIEMMAPRLPSDSLAEIAGFFYDGPYRNPKMVAVMEAALAATGKQQVGEVQGDADLISDLKEAVEFGAAYSITHFRELAQRAATALEGSSHE